MPPSPSIRRTVKSPMRSTGHPFHPPVKAGEAEPSSVRNSVALGADGFGWLAVSIGEEGGSIGLGVVFIRPRMALEECDRGSVSGYSYGTRLHDVSQSNSGSRRARFPRPHA